ncbi:hypothetical protein ASPSYDRAFT_29968 [Aspergillus sydowii CBS 593.65]|jgi:enamine deaminase RidA (YjgF/YER057c/UK114 family)|uniref:Uncharacterized protein n=1 Tax=Aspergillus sydowii CBS 593.65 TaxID=1036612 RepID=A0A1L9TPX9_9EURO|nr:uncharacterized protein ASPSYDRAFT_29968 [Aspergillus sydowii CBS 593.65]OJJ61480.1 hypothetical protein ASPSYDRAFT_29968 [Aspergillus sydowii CBS 593.65]
MAAPQFYNYPGAESDPKNFHYSQTVKIGNIVKTCGQGGWDEDGNISLYLSQQVSQAFDNVEKALKNVDERLSWEHVYAVRSYHVDIDHAFHLVTEQFKQRMSHRPIWTCMQIGKLALDGMQVEIEVEAHYPF